MIKKKVIIFGDGSHAKIVESEIRKLKYKITHKFGKNNNLANLKKKLIIWYRCYWFKLFKRKIVLSIEKIIPNLKWITIISKDKLF